MRRASRLPSLFCSCGRRLYATEPPEAGQVGVKQQSVAEVAEEDDGPADASSSLPAASAMQTNFYGQDRSIGVGEELARMTFGDSSSRKPPPAVPMELQASRGNATYSTWFVPPKRTDVPPDWARARRELRKWSWPPSKERVEVARVRLHAYTTDLSRLNFFTDFAQRASDALGIPTAMRKIPTDIAAASMTAGPFAQAKTKTYFWRRTHRKELVAYNASPEVLQNWFEYLKRTIMPGIGIRIETAGYHRFSFGEGMGQSRTSDAESLSAEGPRVTPPP